MPLSIKTIEDRIHASRLEPRGAFYCTANDQIPPLPCGSPTRSLVLIGTIGSGFWPAFDAVRPAPEAQSHPLDAYSRRLILEMAEEFNATALFPFGGPPWWPFLRWAQRAEDVHPSSLGPLIHPDYGLWHAYRGALCFATELNGISTPPRAAGPCTSCPDKPCLNTCPVSAFSTAGYAVPVCIEHLLKDVGRPCMDTGCLARQACPVGSGYRYQPEHAHFHMQAFVAGQTRAGTGI